MKTNQAKKAVKLSLTKETIANVTKTGLKAGVVKKLSVSFAVKGEGGLCCI